MEQLEPKFMKSRTEHALPNRPTLRQLIELPNWMKSIILTLAPNRMPAVTDIEDPSLVNCLIEQLEPTV
jgi:hypothetical protein